MVEDKVEKGIKKDLTIKRIIITAVAGNLSVNVENVTQIETLGLLELAKGAALTQRPTPPKRISQ